MKNMLMKFMKNAARNDEFEMFLNIFTELPKMKFAVIKISGSTLEKHIDEIAEDIAYLNKLDIYPIIVHGGGSKLDKRLPNSKKIDGLRVTPKDDMVIIEDVFNNIANEFVTKIKEKGGNAVKAPYIFETIQLKEELGHVGNVQKTELMALKEIIFNNATPVISPIGICRGEHHNINADTAAKELVKAISPKKLIFITEKGGIVDENDRVIPFLNVYGNNLQNITDGMLLKVNEIKDFLKRTDSDCAVVITSAENLLKEIFTVKGGGTFIKHYTIRTTKDINSLNKEKLMRLLENTFDKTLIDGYFNRDIKEVFYQKDYYGLAIIKNLNGVGYLDKFSVSKHWQGTGLGKSLWIRITEKYPKLIWRAREGNDFNDFYLKNCDGMMKKKGWCIYWRDLEDNELFPIVEAVVKIEKTMLTEEELNEYMGA